MLKLSGIIFLLLFSQVFAIEVTVVNKDVDYKELLTKEILIKADVDSVKKLCEPIPYSELITNKYLAKRYMKKGTVICDRDVEEYEKKSVLFNFGTIQIEKYGKIIFENDEYIKIKDNDGNVEKIYKDGRIE
ncbi:hypothetical protein CRV08_02490 [Halarcobacter ebronensis]|uniref:Flagella basal body P-ring formation protein FlgA n=2 Tax=Halarcobacter ebronensis TaxID=1462615 RepID=A0A4Q0YG80_9BACT|nr:hypothetical protein CRV08_02490 [Halarcobacter ebronensis]